MKLNHIFMCLVAIIVIIPHSVNAFPLAVTQEWDECQKRCFGVYKSNIEFISTNINKTGSFYNTGLVNEGNMEITGKPVNLLPVHQTSGEVITTTSPDECANYTKPASDKRQVIGSKIHFWLIVLSGGLAGLIIGQAIIWSFFLFIQRQHQPEQGASLAIGWIDFVRLIILPIDDHLLHGNVL
jgi:hypothetical protein